MLIKGIKSTISKFILIFLIIEFLSFSIVSFFVNYSRIKNEKLKIAYHHIVTRGAKKIKGFIILDLNKKNVLKINKFNIKPKNKKHGIFLRNLNLYFYFFASKEKKIILYKTSLIAFTIKLLFLPFVFTILSFLSFYFFFKFFKFNRYYRDISNGVNSLKKSIEKIIKGDSPDKVIMKKLFIKDFEEISEKLLKLHKNILEKERARKLSFQMWKKALDKFPLLLIFVDKDNKIVSLNEPARKFLSSDFKEFSHLDSTELSAISSNVKEVFKSSKSFSLGETVLKGKSGKFRLFDINLIPMGIKEEKGVLIIAQDKTDIDEAHLILKTFMNLEDKAVIITSEDFKIKKFNKESLKLFNEEKNSFKEKNLSEFFVDFDSFKEKVATSNDQTFNLLTKNGKKVNIIFSTVKERTGDKKNIFFIEDISREISLKEELSLKKILIAIVSEIVSLARGQRIFTKVLSNIASLLNFEYVYLYRTEDGKTFEKEKMIMVKPKDIEPKDNSLFKEKINFINFPILRSVLIENRLILSNEDSSDKKMLNLMKKRGIKTIMAFPIYYGSKIFKFILFVNHSQHIRYTEKEQLQIDETLKLLNLYYTMKYYKEEWNRKLSSLLSVYEKLEDPLYIIDPSTYEIVYKNKGFEKTFGRDTEDKKCYEIIYKKNKPCRHCILISGKIDKEDSDKKLHGFNGNYYQLEQRKVELSKEKKLIINLMRDVTEKYLYRKRAEQVQKKELLGDLVGGIAHDMNNILSGMSGYFELLEISSSEEKKDEYIAKLKGILNKAHKLVFQTLNFSREKSDILEIDIINKVIDDALLIVNPSLPSNIEIIREDEGEFFVKGNFNQLSQVFLNLITNARDALAEKESGKIWIKIGVESIGSGDAKKFNVQNKKFVVVSVKDNGEGIEKKNLKKIFEPFFSTKEKDKVKGSGIGLYITKRIVTAHGGFVKVNSLRGKGTTFFIYLPLYEGKKVKEKREEERILPSELETSLSGKVLILSEGGVFLESLEKLLEFLGFETFITTTLEEVKDIVKKETPDFFFIDFNVNKEDEKNFLKLLTFVKKYVKKIVFIESIENKELGEKIKTKYDSVLLSKPFSIYSLYNILKNFKQ